MHNHIDAAAYVPSFITFFSVSAGAANATVSSPSACKCNASVGCTNTHTAKSSLPPSSSSSQTSAFRQFSPLQQQKINDIYKYLDQQHNTYCPLPNVSHLPQSQSLSFSSPPTKTKANTVIQPCEANVAVDKINDNSNVSVNDNRRNTVQKSCYNGDTSLRAQHNKFKEKRFLISQQQYKFVFATLSWNVELQRILLRNATSPLRATFVNKTNNHFCNKQHEQRNVTQRNSITQAMCANNKQTSQRFVHTWAQMLMAQPKLTNQQNNGERQCQSAHSLKMQLDIHNPTAFPSLYQLGKHKGRRKSRRSQSQQLTQGNERKLPLRLTHTEQFDAATQQHANMVDQEEDTQSNYKNNLHSFPDNNNINNDDNNNSNDKRQVLFQLHKGQTKYRTSNQRRNVRQMLLQRYNKEISTPNLTIKLIVPSVIDDTLRSQQLYAAPDEVCEAFFSNLHMKPQGGKSSNACRSNSTTGANVHVNTRKQKRRHGKLLNADRQTKNKCKVSTSQSEKKQVTGMMPDLYFQPWRLPVSKISKHSLGNANNTQHLIKAQKQQQQQQWQQQQKKQTTHSATSKKSNQVNHCKSGTNQQHQQIGQQSEQCLSKQSNLIKTPTACAVRHDLQSAWKQLSSQCCQKLSFIHHDNDFAMSSEKNMTQDDDDDDNNDEIPLFQLSRRATRSLRPVQAPFNKLSRKQNQLFYEDRSVLRSLTSFPQCNTSYASQLLKAKMQSPQSGPTQVSVISPLHYVNDTNQQLESNFSLYNNVDDCNEEQDKQIEGNTVEETKPCTPVNSTLSTNKQSYTSPTQPYHNFDFFHQMFLRSFIVIALTQIKLAQRLARVVNCTALDNNGMCTKNSKNKHNSTGNVLQPEQRKALSFFYRYYDAYKEMMMKLVMRSEDEFMRRSFQEILKNEQRKDENRSSRCENNCQSCSQTHGQTSTQLHKLKRLIEQHFQCSHLLAIDQLFISGKYAAWQPLLMDIFDITRVVQCYAQRDTLSTVEPMQPIQSTLGSKNFVLPPTHLCASQQNHPQHSIGSNNKSNNVAQSTYGNSTAMINSGATHPFGAPFTPNATHQQLLANSLHKFIVTNLDDIYTNLSAIETGGATFSTKHCTSLQEEESEMYLQYILRQAKQSDVDTFHYNNYDSKYNNFTDVSKDNSSVGAYNAHNTLHYPHSMHECSQTAYQTHSPYSACMANTAIVHKDNILQQIFTPLQWCETAMSDNTLHQCGVKLYKAVLPISRRVVHKMAIPAQDTEKYNLARFFQPSIFQFIAGGAFPTHQSPNGYQSCSHIMHKYKNHISTMNAGCYQKFNNSYDNNYIRDSYINFITNSFLQEQQQVLNVNTDQSINNTLVHCSAGMHRSSGLVIAFLLYMMYINELNQISTPITNQTSTHLYGDFKNHSARQCSSTAQSDEERAKQIVNVCLQHVRQQRQIAQPIPSVVKMLQKYAVQLHFTK